MAKVSRPQCAQGLRDFADFQDYYDNWICKNVIPDLNTIFDGTLAQWEANGRPKNGRGDFFLAAMLFSLFDHLGGFLAGNARTSQKTTLNISRLARRLPTIADIDLIVATFGRQALVHGAWPQTGYRMRDGKWGFGLGICCDPRLTEHDLLYTRHYTLRPGESGSDRATVLKLVVNVNVLRLELIHWLEEQLDPQSVNPDVWNDSQARSLYRGETDQADVSGRHDISRRTQWKQINRLRDQAMELGVWDVPDIAVGRQPPHARSPRDPNPIVSR